MDQQFKVALEGKHYTVSTEKDAPDSIFVSLPAQSSGKLQNMDVRVQFQLDRYTIRLLQPNQHTRLSITKKPNAMQLAMDHSETNPWTGGMSFSDTIQDFSRREFFESEKTDHYVSILEKFGSAVNAADDLLLNGRQQEVLRGITRDFLSASRAI